MPADDVTTDNLGGKIFNAAKTTFSEQFAAIESYLKTETETLGETLRMIIEARAKHEMSEDEAKILLNQQKTAASAVITAASGMKDIAVKSAINSALSIVKDFVNSKVGFPLL